MLEQIRRGAQSGLSYILVGVLIVFFAVFFGVPADGCRAADGSRVLMANVAGEAIHTEDVNIIQNHYFRSDQRRTTLDDEYFRRQAEALKVVAMTHLLAERAEQMGLRVSEEELAAYLTNSVRNPEFLRFYGQTGQYHGPHLEEHVSFRLRTTFPSYHDYKEKELLARNYFALLEMQTHITDEEIEELNRLRNTSVNLEYVLLSVDNLVDVLGITDEEVEAFVQDPASQERIEAYLDDHRDEYDEPGQVLLRNIRIARPSDLEDSEAVEQARQRFEEARTRVLDQNEDFGDVARDLSEDFYRDEGGLRGWETLDAIDQDMAAAVEDADVGEIVELETDAAFFLVKVEDRQEPVITEVEDVAEEIATILLRRDLVADRGLELAQTLHSRLSDSELSLREALEALEQDAREEERLQDAEVWASLSVATTGPFTLEGQQMPPMFQDDLFGGAAFGRAWDEIPGLGQNRELAVASFQLDDDAPLIDEVVELDEGLAVVRLYDRQDPPEQLDPEQRAELAFEVRMEKIDALLGDALIPFSPFQAPGFFSNPSAHTGHYIESVFEQGMKDGNVRLYERNSRAAALLRQMSEEPDDVPEADFEVDPEELLELTEEDE